jgi:hypothetical protein
MPGKLPKLSEELPDALAASQPIPPPTHEPAASVTRQ